MLSMVGKGRVFEPVIVKTGLAKAANVVVTIAAWPSPNADSIWTQLTLPPPFPVPVQTSSPPPVTTCPFVVVASGMAAL